MTDSLKALDTKIENKSVFALTILVGTSLLCVATDNISLKMVSNETRSNENVFTVKYFLNHLYARMVFVPLNSCFNRIVNI